MIFVEKLEDDDKNGEDVTRGHEGSCCPHFLWMKVQSRETLPKNWW